MCALEIWTTWKGGISIQPGMWDTDGFCGRAPPQLHMNCCANTNKVVGKVVPFCFVVPFEG